MRARLKKLARWAAARLWLWAAGPKEEPENLVRSDPSGFLNAAFPGGSGSRVECCCGREHFGSTESATWEDGELEWLLEMAQKEPGQYIDHGDWPGFSEGPWGRFVWGCECHEAQCWENTIWVWRRAVASYLKNRARAQRERAQHVEAELEGCE